ncbi:MULTISPECIES: hypothetical protein [Gracilimonas]|uniref:hypothetical protein n=1 Tax=Gracilimonas TaxID=649462 RepID=UPI001B2D0B90|nr:hypothetical protein [Gracilimonas sp.]MBO6615893.1 PD40 domain-containing protein [Gracilimonas sp.]
MRFITFIFAAISIVLLAGCDLIGGKESKPTVPGKIVFSKSDKSGDYLKIFKMNTDGSGVKKLVDFNGLSSFQPSWGPDGQQIVFTSAKMGIHGEPAIFLMNADGSNKRPMKVYPEYPAIAIGGDSPVLSPDGSRIAYEVCSNCGGAGGRNFEIMVYDFETDSITRVTNNHWPDRHPSWSPDGTKLAFSTELPYADTNIRGFKQDIYTISLEDGTLTRITNTGNASAANWSPDGRFIAYQTSVGGEQSYIYDLENNSTTQLLPGFRTSFGIQWSRKGSMIAVKASKNSDLANEVRYYNIEENNIEFVHLEQYTPQVIGTRFKWYYNENE